MRPQYKNNNKKKIVMPFDYDPNNFDINLKSVHEMCCTPFPKGVDAGLCYGIACLAIKTLFSTQLTFKDYIFDEPMRLLHQMPGTFRHPADGSVCSLGDAISGSKKISRDRLAQSYSSVDVYLKVSAFIDELYIYQKGTPGDFIANVNYQDLELSSVTSSTPIIKIYHQILCFENNRSNIFMEIVSFLEKNFNKNFGVIISSDTHAIAVTFKKETSGYKRKVFNHSKSTIASSKEAILPIIFDAMKGASVAYLFLSVSIFIKKDQEDLFNNSMMGSRETFKDTFYKKYGYIISTAIRVFNAERQAGFYNLHETIEEIFSLYGIKLLKFIDEPLVGLDNILKIRLERDLLQILHGSDNIILSNLLESFDLHEFLLKKSLLYQADFKNAKELLLNPFLIQEKQILSLLYISAQNGDFYFFEEVFSRIDWLFKRKTASDILEKIKISSLLLFGQLLNYKISANDNSEIDEIDQDGTTVLHCTCMEGDLLKVKFLVNYYNANISVVKNGFGNAIEIARLFEHIDIVKFLSEKIMTFKPPRPIGPPPALSKPIREKRKGTIEDYFPKRPPLNPFQVAE